MRESLPLFVVRDLAVHFPIRKGVFARTTGFVRAVDGVSFEVSRGETLGVVGESGCGKSTLSRAMLGLIEPTAGEIRFEGRRVRDWRRLDYHRRVQAVFQDPLSSLNPRHTVSDILSEGPVYHGLVGRRDARAYATELLERVGLTADALDRYPHEFSGGQRQRICIARAIALKPEFLICDEAVSALDLTIRAQVLDLLRNLKAKMDLSLLFITHDLGVVQHVADRVLVMNQGKIVESGSCAEVIAHPKAEYTRQLVAAVPRCLPRS